MPSPFPGMDPYLEDGALWPGFHRQFVQTLHQILQPSLTYRYLAHIKQRHYVGEEAPSASEFRQCPLDRVSLDGDLFEEVLKTRQSLLKALRAL